MGSDSEIDSPAVATTKSRSADASSASSTSDDDDIWDSPVNSLHRIVKVDGCEELNRGGQATGII